MTKPIDRCPACNGSSLTPFYAKDGVASHSCLLMDDEVEALAFPKGDLRIVFCDTCAFVFNTHYNGSLAAYSARYEETQAFSPLFREFARDLAKRWVDKYDLHDRSVLELGCGKGEFLVNMIEQGAGSGIGIDPGVHPERIDPELTDRLTWIADYYGPKYTHLKADAVVCRHTMEHISPVGDWMRSIREAIGDQPDTVVLFELPDVLRILEEAAYWDVYYEHCSYFSAGSLARLFRATGFEVLEVSREYDDQYLVIEAKPSTTPAPGEPLEIEDDVERLRASLASFDLSVATSLANWSDEIRAVRARGGRVAIWGSGSKGVSFFAGLGEAARLVDYAVDVNPYKHGKFMAGSGHAIVAPDRLATDRPELVIVMNPIYLDEIGESLAELGVSTDLRAI
ncbi:MULTISPECIES: class I SAM-dependent methyltransferase [unclassified Pseudofrankia]|uniref:class I SAM-dependent methyltransferase n=1 Tax=unclassified Pseudofrankia TaxID=2994372 RepID=UPI0008DB0FFC|nr:MULTISPECIES: class I SAM-dependent methyltransferase [unclassified Pseudofrankia]MDT3443510.1 class I SAM-dependent methyltransferase [Pseudofrankia sp. BMG5.37]OHV42718.1 SAM-dependent methyltransferase [Pseudofrankia sp. BMG5.36]